MGFMRREAYYIRTRRAKCDIYAKLMWFQNVNIYQNENTNEINQPLNLMENMPMKQKNIIKSNNRFFDL